MDEDPDTSIDSFIDTDTIDHVLLEFCDLNGMSRSKQVTLEYFRETWRDGFAVNMLLPLQTPRNRIPSGTGYGKEINYGDGLLRPDVRTAKRLPWRDDVARVLCNIEFESASAGILPRAVLRSVLSGIDLDLDLYVGSELEFYLLEDDDQYTPVTDGRHEWVSSATEEFTAFYDRLSNWAQGYDVPLQSLEHEHGSGQVEVLFDYGTPLSQADTTFDFKRLVKQTATHEEYTATFMSKPFGEQSASGYHLHVSAFENEDNAFADGSGGLSEMGESFLAGILDHAGALTAFHAPTPNAYKRFTRNGFAPSTASWGFDNRQAALRIPSGTLRIENRLGSADANPYLLVASTLAAGVDGVERSLEPTAPVSGNPADSRRSLPRSLPGALDALENDDVLTEALGNDLVRGYVANKRRQLEAYRSHVSDWERSQYVDLL